MQLCEGNCWILRQFLGRRYFSETHVVLSPFDGPKTASFDEIKGDNFYSEAVASTPQKVNKTIPKDAVSSKYFN